MTWSTGPRIAAVAVLALATACGGKLTPVPGAEPPPDASPALELGFDAGFGPGTKPGDVASYLVERLCGGASAAVATA